jgi:hypothetical protein
MKRIISVFLFIITTINAVQAQESIKIEKIKASHRTVYTDIIIDATPVQVWSVLMDSKTMPDWSNSFTQFEGEMKDSGNVIVHIKRKPIKNKITQVKHQIFMKKGEYFGWNDSKILGVSDNHFFKVVDMGNGKTKFVQSDEFKGGMTWLLGGAFTNFTKKLYPLFNNELKTEVERRFNK